VGTAAGPRRPAQTLTMRGPILIAGRRGRVAQDLVAEAQRSGVVVCPLGRPELDIENPETIARAIAVQAPCAIVNAAAVGGFDEADRDPARAFALNRDGAAHLAAAARQAGVPLLHLSSDYVFDGAKRAPYVEDDPVAPLSLYGRSKAEGEQAVLDADPSALIVRTSWVYGPHGANFLTAMLRLAETEDEVRVVADQHGTPTFGADLARALFAIVARLTDERADVAPGIYHVAGTGVTSWLGFAEGIFAGWARRGHRVPRIVPIRLADWTSGEPRPHYSALDSGKAARVFGIRMPPWEESLEECLDALDRTRRNAQRV
jgi:dTDP-4-dehydrorhamnose reductase